MDPNSTLENLLAENACAIVKKKKKKEVSYTNFYEIIHISSLFWTPIKSSLNVKQSLHFAPSQINTVKNVDSPYHV